MLCSDYVRQMKTMLLTTDGGDFHWFWQGFD